MVEVAGRKLLLAPAGLSLPFLQLGRLLDRNRQKGLLQMLTLTATRGKRGLTIRLVTFELS